MELIALCFLCAVLGLVIGYEWGDKSKAKPIRGEGEAPAPALNMGFDENNPINGRFVRVMPAGETPNTLTRLH